MLISFEFLVKKYNLKVTGILHVGAHECEELSDYIKGGVPIYKILWLEGNPRLVENMRKANPNVYVVMAVVSDIDGQKCTFNITNNGQSSSILELGTHANHYPHIRYIDKIDSETMTIKTLYDQERIHPKFANFLNMDIQGAELQAIKGMGDLLDNFDYLYLEVNTEELYVGCALLKDLDEYLDQRHFKRVEINMTPSNWGDAFYIRKD
jgi:FkbM family methyltransferase